MGGRGEGGPRRCSQAPCPRGVARGPRPSPPSSPAQPRLVYTFSRGRRAALGAGRGLVGRRWVSLAGGGGVSLCRGLFPRLPRAGTKAGRLVCAFLGATVSLRPTAPAQSRRWAAGNAGVGGRPTGGGWRAAALACGVGPPPLRPASGRPHARWGERRGGAYRSLPLVPWRRPRAAAGGRPAGSGHGRPAADGGGALFPRPPPPFGCHTLVQAFARAPCSPRCRRAVPAGRRGGGRAGECSGRRFESAVSG